MKKNCFSTKINPLPPTFFLPPPPPPEDFFSKNVGNSIKREENI